jgi:hypothetical protein
VPLGDQATPQEGAALLFGHLKDERLPIHAVLLNGDLPVREARSTFSGCRF